MTRSSVPYGLRRNPLAKVCAERFADSCVSHPRGARASFRRALGARGTKGAGWYSFHANGVHFVGLVNVVDLKAGGLGNLGTDQLAWLEDDLKARSASNVRRTALCGCDRAGTDHGLSARVQHSPLGEDGFDFWAVSDINAEELTEFSNEIAAALRRAGA
jgi:hypothetical protein